MESRKLFSLLLFTVCMFTSFEGHIWLCSGLFLIVLKDHSWWCLEDPMWLWDLMICQVSTLNPILSFLYPQELFLGKSVRVFPEEISIWSSGLSLWFPHCGWHHPSCGDLERTKRQRKDKFKFALCLCAWTHTSFLALRLGLTLLLRRTSDL